MNKLADVVVRYNKTALTVVGHTDSVGTDSYNHKPEQRALSVARYLEAARAFDALATAARRDPTIAPNSTDGGRQANRRVARSTSNR